MIFIDIRRRPIAAIVTLILVILGIALGIWQLNRAAYKEELAAQIEFGAKANPILLNGSTLAPEQILHRRVQARGVYLKDQGVWLENRPHPLGRDPQTGIATGFYLLMPMRLSENPQQIIWVNRGWVPRNFQKLNQVPEIITSVDENLIEGIALESATKTYVLGKESGLRATDGLAIQENIHFQEEQNKLQLDQYPFVLRQDNPEIKDGLQRLWPLADRGVEKHLGYAFQWFALAFMSLVFWIVTAYRAHAKSLR
jgi:surfeit locus 1 family protein